MVEDTCRGAECIHWDEGKCPFVHEAVWIENKPGSRQRLVRDCAPRRTLIMLQDQHQRLDGLQAALEQQRNRAEALERRLADFLALARMSAKQRAVDRPNLKARLLGAFGIFKED